MEVEEAQANYLAATALERPALKNESLAKSKYVQVERMMRPHILEAAPKCVKDQLLARGDFSVMRITLEMCIESAP